MALDVFGASLEVIQVVYVVLVTLSVFVVAAMVAAFFFWRSKTKEKEE